MKNKIRRTLGTLVMAAVPFLSTCTDLTDVENRMDCGVTDESSMGVGPSIYNEEGRFDYLCIANYIKRDRSIFVTVRDIETNLLTEVSQGDIGETTHQGFFFLGQGRYLFEADLTGDASIDGFHVPILVGSPIVPPDTTITPPDTTIVPPGTAEVTANVDAFGQHGSNFNYSFSFRESPGAGFVSDLYLNGNRIAFNMTSPIVSPGALPFGITGNLEFVYEVVDPSDGSVVADTTVQSEMHIPVEPLCSAFDSASATNYRFSMNDITGVFPSYLGEGPVTVEVLWPDSTRSGPRSLSSASDVETFTHSTVSGRISGVLTHNLPGARVVQSYCRTSN